MSKRSSSSIFTTLLALASFCLLLILLWSFELIEERTIQMAQKIEALSEKLDRMQFRAGSDQAINTLQKKKRPHIDKDLPNLLTADPFYQTTLATLLPEGFVPRGVRRAATIGRPKNLHPFNGWVDNSRWYGYCVPSLTEMHTGIFETMAPALAIKIEERQSKKGLPEFWVHLRDDAFWEPLHPDLFDGALELAPHFLKRHPVTAEDFKFYWQAMMNPHLDQPGAVSLRNYFGDIEEIEVMDDHTFVVRWRGQEVKGEPKIKFIARYLTGGLKPLPSFVYKYFPDGSKIVDEDGTDTYQTNSVWAQNFSEHWAKNIIVSIGPYIFQEMTDQVIRFKRNPRFYDQKLGLMEGIEETFRESPDSLWQDFKIGATDTYGLNPTKIIEWKDFSRSEEYQKQKEEEWGIKRLDYLGRAYAYIGWNAKRPFFSDQKLRQAMTMAIDRKRIIRDMLNGNGEEITGPSFKRSSEYDSSIEPWPFDPERARAILDEAGWIDRSGNGIREQEIDGELVPFEFALTYFVKSPVGASICAYIAEALKEIGVRCTLRGVDVADLSKTADERDFDAIMLAWSLGTPPSEHKQLWHSDGAKEQGSSNFISFANEEADEIIEKLQFEYDKKERQRLYHRFHAIIHEEAPYTFLYNPKSIFLYREWLKNVFIPAERQDLIPGANVEAPITQIFWLERD